MKRYLNSKTREDVVIIAGVIELLKEIKNRWSDNMKNPPKKVLKFLRSSSSFAECAMHELDKELDGYEFTRLVRMAETTEFKLHYVKHDLSSKIPGVITYDITEEERDNIVEALAEVRCTNCDGCIKNCTVRSQFFKWDVSPIYEVIDKEHPCQYMYPVELKGVK